MSSITKNGKSLKKGAKSKKLKFTREIAIIPLLFSFMVSTIYFGISLGISLFRSPQFAPIPFEEPIIIQVPKLLGDVNEDNVVDYGDLELLGRFLGTSQGDRYWVPMLDLRKDGKINVLDLSILGMSFGNTVYP